MNAAATAVRTTVISMVTNGSLAAVKIGAGVIGHSYALIADGIESLNDLFSSGVVLIALRVSAKPPDADHPYGHGKAEQLGALFSAISLLAAGGTIAVQSFQNLFHRHTSPAWFTLPVLVVVIVTKELLSRYALQKSDETTSAALKGDAWHHRSDAITSAAAFVGITIALIGGPGFEKADDVAALLGCIVIGYNGVKLLNNALYENMEGAPAPELIEAVRTVARGVRGVREIEKVRMKKSGLGYHMDIHVQVDGTISVEAGHAIGHEVQAALLQSNLRVLDVVVHVEPVRARSS
ncbi:MAG TPA: cation diffusion facilitator family transporter [Opitutaceae bacterium]|nr:cation diffusion facilitator family transporter [Opitutaceae bacterium]